MTARTGGRSTPSTAARTPSASLAEDLKGLIEDAAIGGPLEDCHERGNTLEYVGTEDIDGTVAHKLKLTAKERRPALRVPRSGPFPRNPGSKASGLCAG